MAGEWIRTACPRNCYSSCGFFVEVTGGRVTGYKPDPSNKATPEGMCLKGQSYLERIYSSDRLRYPLRKNNQGGYDRIAWEEALGEIATHLEKIARESGPQSVLFYAGSGRAGLVNDLAWKFWDTYGGATTTYGNLCWPAGLEATRLTLGDNKHNAPWDLENARLIIMWGKNAAETNIHEMLFVDRALAAGAEMIVIDPRRTPTADKAHLLIQPRPGTDGALALGVAGLLIRENKTDRDFIERYVLGYDDFTDVVQAFTPEKVSGITGIPEKYIYRLAEKIGGTKPMTILPGYGLQRYTNGGQTIRCILALQVITGNIGKKGACWHYANLQSYVYDQVKEPLSYYPPESPGKFRYGVSKARMGADMLRLTDPPLRAAWIERGNPLSQNPDSPALRKTLKKLEFILVIDQFLTDTARMADIVLPAVSLFEQPDIMGSYWHPYVQWKPRVVDPPGEVKTEAEIYALLARRMFTDDPDLPATPAAMEKWLKTRTGDQAGLSWEALQSGPVVPDGAQEIAFADMKFNTPSGKIELRSERAAQQWKVSPLPDYVALTVPEQMKDYPLYLQTPNTKNRIHSQFGNLNVIRAVAGKITLDMNPADARKRGIADGDRVRVFNVQGDFYVPVRFDYGMIPGVVSIPNGIWHAEGACPNELSAALETDMGFGAAFHNTRVEVEKSGQT